MVTGTATFYNIPPRESSNLDVLGQCQVATPPPRSRGCLSNIFKTRSETDIHHTRIRFNGLKNFTHVYTQAYSNQYYDYKTKQWKSISKVEKFFRELFANICDSVSDKCLKVSMRAFAQTFADARKLKESISHNFDCREAAAYINTIYDHHIHLDPSPNSTWKKIVTCIRYCSISSQTLNVLTQNNQKESLATTTKERFSQLQGFKHVSEMAKQKFYFNYETRAWCSALLEPPRCPSPSEATDTITDKCLRLSMQAFHRTYVDAVELKEEAVFHRYQWQESSEFLTAFFIANPDNNIKELPTERTPTQHAIASYIAECNRLCGIIDVAVNRTLVISEVAVKLAPYSKENPKMESAGPKEYSTCKFLIQKTKTMGIPQLKRGGVLVVFRNQQIPLGYKMKTKVGHVKQLIAWEHDVPYKSLHIKFNGQELPDSYILPVRVALN